MKFTPGMRVVVVDGGWNIPRITGTYGKVTEIQTVNEQDYVHIQVTGHIDGGNPPDLASFDVMPLYPEELTVVD